MEDNRLKEEIIAITGNVFPKDSIVYKDLYKLTADVACQYADWREENTLYNDFIYYLKGENQQSFTPDKLFAYFLTHIYQPR